MAGDYQMSKIKLWTHWVNLRAVPLAVKLLYISYGLLFISLFNHLLWDEYIRWLVVLWCDVSQHLLLAYLILKSIPERQAYNHILAGFLFMYIIILRYGSCYVDIYALSDDFDGLIWALKMSFLIGLTLTMFSVSKIGKKLKRKLWTLFRL
jgi:hypothetical protein